MRSTLSLVDGELVARVSARKGELVAWRKAALMLEARMLDTVRVSQDSVSFSFKAVR